MNKYAQGDRNQNKDKDRNKFVRVNWKIKAQSCRIIEDGKPPRVMATNDAIDYARNMGYDLVEVGYDRSSGQSICKILDYGKYVYEQKRREKEMKKAARAAQVETKCVQFSLTIDVADLERMVKKARAFLEEGDRVKLSLRFRGRQEMNHVDDGKKMMRDILERFEGLAVLDGKPSMAGRELSCVIRKA